MTPLKMPTPRILYPGAVCPQRHASRPHQCHWIETMIKVDQDLNRPKTVVDTPNIHTTNVILWASLVPHCSYWYGSALESSGRR